MKRGLERGDMIVRKSSIFPARREEVLTRLQRLETLQYIASPYATFTPVEDNNDFSWREGAASSYRFRLFGFMPFGIHTIRSEELDQSGIQSREHNKHVPVWDHLNTLEDLGDRTKYTDEVEIHAGWKTVFVWLWAKAFYAHRQRKWIRLLQAKTAR